jgi:hypothetical protein
MAQLANPRRSDTGPGEDRPQERTKKSCVSSAILVQLKGWRTRMISRAAEVISFAKWSKMQ